VTEEPTSQPKTIVRIDDGRNDGTTDEVTQQALDIFAAMGLAVERGPIVACDTCEHFSCVCDIKRDHAESCIYRKARTCPIGVPCDHGDELCPTCYACTCVGAQKEP
jgi:hypothetical protein